MDYQFKKFDDLLEIETSELSSLIGDLDTIRIDLGNITKEVK